MVTRVAGARLRLGQRVALCILAGITLGACTGTPETAPSQSATPSGEMATEASLQTFAESYLDAVNQDRKQSADEHACDGVSTIFTTYADLPITWKVTKVHVGGVNGTVEFFGSGTTAGFTAKFDAGKWCALQ